MTTVLKLIAVDDNHVQIAHFTLKWFQLNSFGENKLFRGELQIDAKKKKIKSKGIVSDSNSIFLWHKSEDINKNRLFEKLQLITILRLQVMHDDVHWHCTW